MYSTSLFRTELEEYTLAMTWTIIVSTRCYESLLWCQYFVGAVNLRSCEVRNRILKRYCKRVLRGLVHISVYLSWRCARNQDKDARFYMQWVAVCVAIQDITAQIFMFQSPLLLYTKALTCVYLFSMIGEFFVVRRLVYWKRRVYLVANNRLTVRNIS